MYSIGSWIFEYSMTDSREEEEEEEDRTNVKKVSEKQKFGQQPRENSIELIGV